MVHVRTILSYRYQALTRLRLQDLDLHLENEPWVGTPIRQNLLDNQNKTCRGHFKTRPTGGYYTVLTKLLTLISWKGRSCDLSSKEDSLVDSALARGAGGPRFDFLNWPSKGWHLFWPPSMVCTLIDTFSMFHPKLLTLYIYRLPMPFILPILSRVV